LKRRNRKVVRLKANSNRDGYRYLCSPWTPERVVSQFPTLQGGI
jgi:hypothetical protein